MNVQKYLDDLEKKLISEENFNRVIMSREWANNIPKSAGVYIFVDNNNKIVYVGETGNLRGRMKDLLDSRHHTVRRTIGERFYLTVDGYIKATSRIKFPEHIELMVSEHISTKLWLSYLEVDLGRKELEEHIHGKIDLALRLNKRGKRKTS